MRGFLTVGLLCLGLAGCQTTGHRADPDATVKARFDPDAVAYIRRQGTGKIDGTVALTTSNGDVPAKGAALSLVPVGEYSKAVMVHLFQGRNAYFGKRPINKPDPRYGEYMRHAQADANGQYVFQDVPAGRYFVYATTTNKKDGNFMGLLEQVEVGDGQSVRVDLDGV